MRTDWSHLEHYRLTGVGRYATWFGDRQGWFTIPIKGGFVLRCIAHDGLCGNPTGWEHVSVTVRLMNRDDECVMPSWSVMCWVKGQFWEPKEAAMQFHPPESDKVNTHPTCLHLWRQVGKNPPLPDAKMV